MNISTIIMLICVTSIILWWLYKMYEIRFLRIGLETPEQIKARYDLAEYNKLKKDIVSYKSKNDNIPLLSIESLFNEGKISYKEGNKQLSDWQKQELSYMQNIVDGWDSYMKGKVF